MHTQDQKLYNSFHREVTTDADQLEKQSMAIHDNAMTEEQASQMTELEFRQYKTSALMDNILQENNETLKDPASLHQQTLYREMQIWRNVAIIMYVLLGFFHKPAWCRNSGIEYNDTCTQLKYSKKIDLVLFSWPFLDELSFIAIESVLLLFLQFNQHKLYQFSTKSADLQRRYVATMAIAAVVIASDMLYYFELLPAIQIDEFLRPVYLVVHSRSLRTNFFFYCRVYYNSLPMLLICWFNVVFFACFCKVIFKNTLEEATFLKDFADAIYRVFIMETTSNFPDVWLPIYQQHRLVSFLFIGFETFNYIIIFNIILGVVYFNYKNELKKRQKIVESLPGFRNIFAKFVMKKDIEDGLMEQEIDQYAHRSKQRNNSIIKLNSYLQQYSPNQSHKPNINFNFLQINNQSALQSFLLQYVMSIYVEIFLALINLACVISVFFDFSQDQPPMLSQNKGENNYSYNNDVHTCILLLTLSVSMADCSIRAVYFGIRILIRKQKFYVFDLVLTLAAFTVTLCLKKLEKQVLILDLLLFSRAGRVLRLGRKVTTLKVMLKSLCTMMPYISDNLAMLYAIFLFFGALGVHLFGGRMTVQFQETLTLNGINPLLVYNNFNDLGNSFTVMFGLLIVNNWLYSCDAQVLLMGSRWYRWYFVCFYIIVVLLALNIIIASIIEWIVQTWKSKILDQNQNSYQKQGLLNFHGDQNKASVDDAYQTYYSHLAHQLNDRQQHQEEDEEEECKKYELDENRNGEKKQKNDFCNKQIANNKYQFKKMQTNLI